MHKVELSPLLLLALVPFIALACGDEGGNSNGSGGSAGAATGGALAGRGGQAGSAGDDQAGGSPSPGGSSAGGTGDGHAGATSAGAGGDSSSTLETVTAQIATVCAFGTERCAADFDVDLCKSLSAPMANDPCLDLYAARMDCLADLPASSFYCPDDYNLAVVQGTPCQEVMDEHETCLGG